MFATFSNESKVQDGLRDLGCSMNFLCALAGGPSPSLVSLWLGGTKQLDDKVTRPLVETIRVLQQIKQIAAPWPLDFHDARLWKQLLADYHVNVGKQ